MVPSTNNSSNGQNSSNSSPHFGYEQQQRTETPLPFTPKLGDQGYNLQKYQEYIRDQLAKQGVDVSSVVENAEVATGL